MRDKKGPKMHQSKSSKQGGGGGKAGFKQQSCSEWSETHFGFRNLGIQLNF